MLAAVPAGLTSTQVAGFVLLDIAIILVVARLVGALARKVGQPTVVGEIVAGVLLGPSLLGATVFAWGNPWAVLHCDQSLGVASAPGQASITACLFPPQSVAVIGVVGQVALALFMFLVGLELDTSRLKGKLGGITSVAVGVIGLPIMLGFVIGPLLYTDRFVAAFGSPDEPSQVAFALMVGAMLAVTAFPVMARILQEMNLSTTAMGSIGVAAAAAVTVLMFLTVLVAASTARGDAPGDLVQTFVWTIVYFGVLFGVVRPLLERMGRRLEATGMTAEIFATALIVMFASSYFAHQIGINVIVGAFLAGMIMPARALMLREMGARLTDITVIILLPIFLAYSGLNTDFTVLGGGDIIGIVLFLVAGIVAKWAGGAVFSRIGGLSWAEGNLIGILMNCRGLLILVVALVAVNAGVISPVLQVGGVLMALITTMMTGPLVDRFLPSLPAERPDHPQGVAVDSDLAGTASMMVSNRTVPPERTS